MYVSDGYGNRRVMIVDAATGKYVGHFGAYGSNPIDDKAAAAAGPWMNDFTKGNMKPAFFRNPVHCVKISKEGLVYVCDRGNNRVQVFNGRDPNLGKECANPTARLASAASSRSSSSP
jgi:DNA-binding beta-propeller fold protein YncE